MGSLVAAYTVAWSILMVYVLTLGARQRRLRESLERLEANAATPSGTGAPRVPKNAQ